MGISWSSHFLSKSRPQQGRGCFSIAFLEAELIPQARASLRDAGNPHMGNGALKTAASTEIAPSARLFHHS